MDGRTMFTVKFKKTIQLRKRSWLCIAHYALWRAWPFNLIHTVVSTMELRSSSSPFSTATYQLSYLLQSFRSNTDISFTMFLPHQHDYIAITEKLGRSTARAKRLHLHAKLVCLFSTFYTTILFSEVSVSPHQLVNLFNLGRLLTFN